MKYALTFLIFNSFLIFLYFWSAFFSPIVKNNTVTKTPITAEKVVYYSNFVNAEEIEIRGERFQKSDQTIKFEGSSGSYTNLKNKKVITFSGDVTGLINKDLYLKGKSVINEGTSRLTGEELFYKSNEKIFYSNLPITLVFKSGTLSGTDMLYNVETKDLKLKNVRGSLWVKQLRL